MEKRDLEMVVDMLVKRLKRSINVFMVTAGIFVIGSWGALATTIVIAIKSPEPMEVRLGKIEIAQAAKSKAEYDFEQATILWEKKKENEIKEIGNALSHTHTGSTNP